jgi:hypothetical protein
LQNRRGASNRWGGAFEPAAFRAANGADGASSFARSARRLCFSNPVNLAFSRIEESSNTPDFARSEKREVMCAMLKGIVYEPPSEDFPPLVVVFAPDGDLLAVRSAPSVESAEAWISGIVAEVQSRLSELVVGKRRL